MPSFRFLQTLFLLCLLSALLVMLPTREAPGQTLAKYGAEFLAGGVGARALGMGGTHVGLAEDVTAGYWNGAGLNHIQYPEIAYMHVERFAGVVSFDYAAAALPINQRSTVALSFFRSGVNDIANTLDAWNAERGQPKPDYLNRIRRFSAADYAFFMTYARALDQNLSLGASGKIVRRSIGDFADAWGYSFDIGLQYRTEHLMLGVNVQDASTMMQSWSVNTAAFDEAITAENPETDQPYTFEETFGQELPEGGTELVLPVARLGSGVNMFPTEASRLTVGLDVDVHFDGQRNYVAHINDVSFQPRLGAEFSYQEVVSLRAGISRVQFGEGFGYDFTPAVGAGLRLQQVSVDYGFGDFAGSTADLGFSHRISVQLRLEQPRLRRPEQ